MIKELFREEIKIEENLIYLKSSSNFDNQQHTNDAFSEKWIQYDNTSEKGSIL
jgi:hypothetical protein